MNKEVITNKQGISIAALFIMGSALVLNPGDQAKQDVWIAFIIALVISMPMLLLYGRILSLYPGMDLFDILIEIFGKSMGKIIGLLYVWYSFHLGALVIRNFSEFIQIISLQKTPQMIVVLFLGMICIWIVKDGIEVMGRWSAFMLPFILVMIIAVLILSVTEADIDNMKRVLYEGWSPVLKSAYLLFTFPFAEAVVLTMVFSSVKNKFKPTRVFLLGAFIGGVILFFIYVRNILVLGVETNSLLFFSAYGAVTLLKIGSFFQGIEIMIAVNFLLNGIVKTAVCLYAASNGAAKIFNFESHRDLTVPIGFLMMALSGILYSNTMEMIDWAAKIYPFYAIPFQILLPLLIWIIAEMKHRRKTNIV